MLHHWDLENFQNGAKIFRFKNEKQDSLMYKTEERGDVLPPAAGYMVLQEVFFPFSIYAAFAPYKSLVAYGDLFCRSFKTAWLTDEDSCIFFPKQSPF